MLLSSYGLCKPLNALASRWWCRGVESDWYGENCSMASVQSVCWFLHTANGWQPWLVLPSWNRKENWIKWKVALYRILRIPQWDNISKGCSPEVQAEWRTWAWFFLPACFHGVWMKSECWNRMPLGGDMPAHYLPWPLAFFSISCTLLCLLILPFFLYQTTPLTSQPHTLFFTKWLSPNYSYSLNGSANLW